MDRRTFLAGAAATATATTLRAAVPEKKYRVAIIGYVWCNDKPGLGVDLNEEAAAKFPLTDFSSSAKNWGNTRRADGTIVRP